MLRTKREAGIVGYLRRAMDERCGGRRELETSFLADHVACTVQLFGTTTPGERGAVLRWLTGKEVAHGKDEMRD